MRRWLGAILVASAVVSGGSAHAMSCAIESLSPVVFGAYDGLLRYVVDALGGVTFACQSVEPFDQVIVDLGRGSSPSWSTRTMHAGAWTLAYQLYLDAARSTVWGDGTGGTSHFGPYHPSSGTPVEVPIFGRIPAGQNAGVGNYSDTVVITISY